MTSVLMKKHFLKWHLFLQIPDFYIVILDWYHIWLQETTITDDWYIYNKGFINQETSYWISYGIPKVKCFWTILLLCKINYIMQICWVEILTLHPKAHRRIPTVNLAFAYWSWTHWLKFSHVHDKVMLFFWLVPLRFEEELSPTVIIFRHGSINNVMLSHLHCHF